MDILEIYLSWFKKKEEVVDNKLIKYVRTMKDYLTLDIHETLKYLDVNLE
jgi:hypothetical protein